MDSKKKNSLFAIFGIVAVVYVVAFCVIPFHKEAASWVASVFGLIAIAGSCAILFYAFSKGTELKSKVYGFPLMNLAYAYLTAQIALAIIVSITAAFVSTPVWIPLVISVLLIGIVAIGVIATDSARDVIEAQDKEIKLATKQTTLFKLDVNSLLDRCKDPEVKKALGKLSESFRYSDPVSSDELKEIEGQITKELDNLGKLIETDNNSALEKITQIENMLADRNRRCKAMK